MRILIAPVEVSGFYRALNAGFRELGVDSTFAELWPHRFQYSESDSGWPAPVSWARSLARRQQAAPRGSLRRGWWLMLGGIVRVMVFLWALPRFDVFIFGFATTILYAPWLELPVLRALGKKIVFHFHGSDSRPPYLDGYLSDHDGTKARDFARLARQIKRKVSIIDRYADIVVDNPLSSHFHVRECLNSFAIGLGSTDNGKRAPDLGSSGRENVRILHAASNVEAKGTAVIRAAIESLRESGLDLEYVEIVGQPNDRVLEEISKSDFVIDQLYSDTPMAGFAAEAARLGRPAIVCGYASEEFRRWIAPEALPPTLYCHPGELQDAIRRLATDADFRTDLGRRARAFFDVRCKPRDVATRYLSVLTQAVPADWRFDPNAITYVEGCGLAEERARARIAAVLASHGSLGLQLADKPALIQRMTDFATVRRHQQLPGVASQ